VVVESQYKSTKCNNVGSNNNLQRVARIKWTPFKKFKISTQQTENTFHLKGAWFWLPRKKAPKKASIWCKALQKSIKKAHKPQSQMLPSFKLIMLQGGHRLKPTSDPTIHHTKIEVCFTYRDGSCASLVSAVSITNKISMVIVAKGQNISLNQSRVKSSTYTYERECTSSCRSSAEKPTSSNKTW
jgi:hypothetical protein